MSSSLGPEEQKTIHEDGKQHWTALNMAYISLMGYVLICNCRMFVFKTVAFKYDHSCRLRRYIDSHYDLTWLFNDIHSSQLL